MYVTLCWTLRPMFFVGCRLMRIPRMHIRKYLCSNHWAIPSFANMTSFAWVSMTRLEEWAPVITPNEYKRHCRCCGWIVCDGHIASTWYMNTNNTFSKLFERSCIQAQWIMMHVKPLPWKMCSECHVLMWSQQLFTWLNTRIQQSTTVLISNKLKLWTRWFSQLISSSRWEHCHI